ncbi:MAG: PDZ domain-containing protein, partial [Candidatus Bathyarchaeia archaeon]
MNRGLAEYFELLVDRGVLIIKVMEESPAYERDLRVGDIIKGIDGNKVDNLEDLLKELQKRKPGDKIELSVIRGDREGLITITLGLTP